jgi:DNA-binding MurR/RpiR family transcriptional regulator
MEPGATVADRLRLRMAELTTAERKVARVLMADYPVAGLDPIAKLAAAAGVSAPTVVRLMAKLEFDGYAEFQQALKAEVSARLSSPLEIAVGRLASQESAEGRLSGEANTEGRPSGQESPAEHPGAARGGALPRSEQLLCDGIRSSFAHLPPGEFDRAVALLADGRRGVTLVGGRFSSVLAEYLAAHLRILRPRVQMLSASHLDRVSSMLDVGRRDVFVAFDYRRYQRDTIRLATTAKDQGATLIAFTDPYLSPLAARADVILTSSVASPSPFDALTPAMALVEALIAALVDRLGDAPRARMARYDELNGGAVDGAGRPGAELEGNDDG